MKVYEASLTYTKTLFEVDTKVLNTPEKAVQYLRDIPEQYPYQETLWAVLLDNKNHAMFRIMLTRGTLTSSLVSPREVFSPAIISGAASVLVMHHHPSGDPSPSNADLTVSRLWEASHKRVYVKRRIMGSGPQRGSVVRRKSRSRLARYFP